MLSSFNSMMVMVVDINYFLLKTTFGIHYNINEGNSFG